VVQEDAEYQLGSAKAKVIEAKARAEKRAAEAEAAANSDGAEPEVRA
jgi:hypothetical protein